jgi:hypothetical protein
MINPKEKRKLINECDPNEAPYRVYEELLVKPE